MSPRVVVGVVEHGNSAELVTLDGTHRFLDRRRIDLTQGLPTHPYHHEGSWAVGRYLTSPWARPTTLDSAIELVATVRAAAHEGARSALKALVQSLGRPISIITLRRCPELPEGTRERILDARAHLVADSVMYREILAVEAGALGSTIQWYDADQVMTDAASAVKPARLETTLRDLGKLAGTPWQARHKLAAAAALAAGG